MVRKVAGMAWIESHQALERHPKTLGLRKHVGWNLNETIGFLHRFWWWALDAAPDGVVTEICEPGVCGDAFGLASDKGDRAIEGMLKVGWLDRLDDATVVIHNHDKYRDRISESRERARIRQQNRRNRLKEQDMESVTNSLRARHAVVTDLSQQHNITQHNKTHNPLTQEETKKENPRGFGGNCDPPPGCDEPRVVSSVLDSGSWVQGLKTLDDIPWDDLSAAHVFRVFSPVFIMGGVRDHAELQRLASSAKVSSAQWTTLFLDKIGVAYAEVGGKTRNEADGTDAVSLTAAGFRPRKGKPQSPTDSARALFREIFFDRVRDPDCARWKGLGLFVIVRELEKRKGKRRKAAIQKSASAG